MKNDLSYRLTILFFMLLSSAMLAQDFEALQYRTVGPARGGRVTTVTGTALIHGTFYLGSSGGGVWKSEDYGTTWNNVSDGFFETPSIGAIEVASNDANIVYVGTGSDGLRSNVIAGKGMYKTIDAGTTWEHIGLRNAGQIGAVEIDPTNSNVVWVAAIGNAFKANPERGIYKTTDGGQNWQKVLFVSDQVGFSDLELLPGNPNVVYAAAWKAQRKPWTIISGGSNSEGGIYKSVNGGKNWKEMSVPHGDNHDIWLNPQNPDILIQANDGGANVSLNGGRTWSTQFNQPTAELYQVEVDDQYPYWLYAGQQDNYSTIAVPSLPPSAIQNPGTGWIINTGGCETGPAVPKPGDHNTVYANCKGRFGVFNKQTGVEQSYYVGASNIYGHNPKDLEYRFQRVAPIHVSPHNPDVIYHGSQYLHKTTSEGKVWETISPDLTAFEADKQVISGSPITRDITGEEYYSTLYSIRESKLKEGLIWTGSNDGVISVTQDGGQTWKNVTPKKMPAGGRVESVEPSHHDAATAYIAVDRHLLGDERPYLYKTSNFGKSWELLTTQSNGIPLDYTARVLREDPVRKGLLYAGTEYGMFMSFDDGKSWKSFQQNLPVTPITDLKIFRGDLVISTMGRGFWILDNITSLRQKAITDMKDEPILFQPDATIRYHQPLVRSKGTFPKYPVTSVLIDYFLPDTVKGGLKLEILDSKNQSLVTVYSDSTELSSDKEVENMDLSRSFRYVSEKLENKPGLNRFAWNLRQKGLWHKDLKRSYKNGPMVPPGVFTVKLTLGSQTLEAPFEIVLDPRVKEEGLTEVDLEKQWAMQLQVRDLHAEARRFQEDLENEAKSLEGKAEEKKRLEEVNSLLKEIKNDEGAYPQQMLLSQIGYLYYMVNGADQVLGNDARERYEELVVELDRLKKKNPAK
jgi:photosystem II stability/assembly factor-like uncharacterized protein